MSTFDSPLQPPLKKQNNIYSEDRISNLHDAVLCHILSFVLPTKFSIRATVLSKRWMNLWAFAPKLDFELHPSRIYSGNQDQFDSFKDLCVNTFTQSIDDLFVLRGSLRIESIRICFPEKFDSFPLRPCSWLCAIIMSNVCEIDLEIGTNGDDFGELPWCLFTCKTIVALKLNGGFTLNVPYYVCLPNLKTLHLKSITYTGDLSIQQLLSGCPILEDLQIIQHPFVQICVLKVVLLSLKRLKLWFYNDDPCRYIIEGGNRKKVVVDAPNLEFIDFRDSYLHDILFKDLTNIVEARIDVGQLFENTNPVLVLLQRIVNVRRLFLSEKTLDILFENEPLLPNLANLVQLELDFAEIHLTKLLRSTPKLEALSFPKGILFFKKDEDPHFLENNPEQVPVCLLHTLKTVKIKQFDGDKDELNLVKYFLKHAMVLEKMTLTMSRWRAPTSPKFIKLHTKLTNCPMLSTHCEIVLKSPRKRH